MPHEHYRNIFNKIPFCQAINSFQPHNLHQHSLNSGSPTKILVTDFHHFKTEDQLGKEASTNSFQEKTWKLRHDKLGTHPGLWLPCEHTQPGIHLHGRIRKVTESVLKCPVVGENCLKSKQHWDFFFKHHYLPAVIYWRNLITVFIYKHNSVFITQNKWYK